MNSKPPSNRPAGTTSGLAGGAPLALLMIAGVIIGGEYGQPTVGLIAGTAIGVAIAIFIWRRGRR
ncbi:hypothetical protein [Sphingobium sp. CR28]|uniref:hypothetical protein n=1 Tax=Sphingobium sp. CR28 TaxID=3400272 RepID=UPI003FEFDF35